MPRHIVFEGTKVIFIYTYNSDSLFPPGTPPKKVAMAEGPPVFPLPVLLPCLVQYFPPPLPHVLHHSVNFSHLTLVYFLSASLTYTFVSSLYPILSTHPKHLYVLWFTLSFTPHSTTIALSSKPHLSYTPFLSPAAATTTCDVWFQDDSV